MPLVVQVPGRNAAVFDAPFTVGRPGRSCDVALDDEYVSSRHARFFCQNGRWLVEDLGSTNGTYLNGSLTRVYGPQQLSKGDQVKIGHTVLVVVPA